jgi:four helix bundle protein
MRDFKLLKVWQKAHQLTLDVYKVTATFPREELYGLVAQMRRSSASIPTNIAEGCGRSSQAELGRFFVIAAGSASELEYQFILARDLNFLDTSLYKGLEGDVIEIKKMLASFLQKLKAED